MATQSPSNLAELLLLRSGLVFVETSLSAASAAGQGLPPAETDLAQRERLLSAFDLELANLGYVASVRLRERLKDARPHELVALRQLVLDASAKATGGTAKLEPLFRRFPEGIPSDTFSLWWDRVVVHFLQEPNQPCVLCRRAGTIHALNPCAHLVCERCFDGSSYSGCPICNRKVDRSSPFFLPPPPRAAGPAPDRRRFALLDLGNPTPERTVETAARELLMSLCQRTQALSPVDVDALLLLLRSYPAQLLSWLPAKIPVRENVAHVFGSLLRWALSESPASRELGASKPARIAAIIGQARPHFNSATDVLRLVCALSGASVALLATAKTVSATAKGASRRFAKLPPTRSWVMINHHRFAVAKLPRALRRELLAVLDRFPEARLLEDLRRHASRWVWLGEHLHPGEYAKRYPTAARAFTYLREGASAVPNLTLPWPSAVATALDGLDYERATSLLAERPGELLRRLDWLLRKADEPHAVLSSFVAVLPRTATPALVSLRTHLATRGAPLPARAYWPKAGYYVPTSVLDQRPSLGVALIAEATARLDEELLRRFGERPAWATAVLDEALAEITVPFNERTASKAAVQLPRGSSVPLSAEKQLRLFIHWCEPQAGMRTDTDLSVGFFDAQWKLRGECTYYSLTALDSAGQAIAKSSGDFTSAPWPDGASEFVDFDRSLARAAGYRYAVMVVNAYSGLPFRSLARATAGVMLRDSDQGAVFDPRTVELAFALSGEHGIYMPLVVDLETSTLHWLDVYSEGQLAFNNVASSQGDIARVCPAMISYFATGTRPSMLELGRLHAAARCQRVVLRGRSAPHRLFVRKQDEPARAFLHRLRTGVADDRLGEGALPAAIGTAPVLALLHQGDVALPEGSASYALFRRKLIPTLAAADLLA